MQAEAGTLIGEEMTVDVKAKCLCQANDDLLVSDSCGLHLMVEVRR